MTKTRLNYEKIARRLGINEQTQERRLNYRKILEGLGFKSLIIYTANKMQAKNIMKTCNGLYQIERLSKEEIPTEFHGQIGLKLTKLETKVTK